ncbi:tRNA (guanine(10)-N(2))-methyltransferase [Purpureocillium takamizusanense]|uniref:tRNA (guanine(10)-N(2))-methyltransferase n=2 Tax=Purpureocillium takamizusanense TaxID=2060973 RepID=A0A9Q8QFZ5_9HYPO|nr:tRNA (guanine(10)-N(2))-methyltransferase [Purpureocillium takamizusanense]UNI19208.1 tRNA (guanine(10)-N(2))-methyltransferase [Purpureocillium takamizusanense]
MEFIIKFAQTHETFRLAEIEALAITEGVDLTVIEYSDQSPLCLVSLPSVEAARKLIRRSILAQSIHEFWAKGDTLSTLHESVKLRTSHLWPQYKEPTFKFDVEYFQGARTAAQRLAIINSFDYLPFDGPIRMKDPEHTFTVFEIWPFDSVPLGIDKPDMVYFGRFVGASSRDVILKFDLKKRGYISTTSMDSELSLVTANIALASPGKLFYDPFVGTGSFPVACAYFGAIGWGSDIDGRSFRGMGGHKSLRGNFEQYGLQSCLGDVFAADLMNSPIQMGRRIWDGIVCDPPYGVREGLRVLGLRDPEKTPWLIEKGKRDGSLPDFVAPKKPYSFFAMLNDILVFASGTLVDNGRLSFWMPTANDEEQEIPVPTHPCLEVVAVCVQVFNKWSRRLITYRRIPDNEVIPLALEAYNAKSKAESIGTTADELNPFRRGYFRKFEASE